ncbi:MAG: helix-turn-helix domain-containing protein, partial [Luteococcus japonicus]
GITAGVDLALSMVEEDLGAERAREVARELVVFLHRSGGQAQFSTALRTPVTTHERLRAVMDLVQADPAAPHGVESMARTASVSSRQRTRLFQRELGTTPARWLEQVRLDHAKQLLLDGHSVTDSAQLSGFGSDETLRRAFWRHLHTTPSEYREHFATSSGRVPGPLEAVSGSGTDVGARPAQS